LHSRENIREALDIICELAIQACHSELACVVRCVDKTASKILGAVGTNATMLAGNAAIGSLDDQCRPMVNFPKVKTEKWFASHPLYSLAPDAKQLRVLSVPTSESLQTYIAVVSNENSRLPSDLPRLLKLAMLASAIIESTTGHFQASANIVADQVGFREQADSVGADAILSFLARTMPKIPALKGRNDFAYLVVRRWKSNFKDVQLAAIKGLKISPSAETISFAASEIVESVEKLFSKASFSCVVPIPGSSSGTANSLSLRIAEQVAQAMGLPFNNCLLGEIELGSSHPKKSMKIKPYKVTQPLSGQVLLVDDIATTGSHLIAARDALKLAGVGVFAVAWIGG
jgi:hypothetical protein